MIFSDLFIEDIKNKTEIWISKNYPSQFLFIDESCNHKISWRSKLYLYINSIDLPSCYCGNPLKFMSVSVGFREFCSTKCLSNSDSVKNSIRNTNIEKFGCVNVMQNADIVKKLSVSVFEKYGVDNISKLEETKLKVKNSNLKKFGYDHYNKIPENKDKLSKLMSLNYNKFFEINSINNFNSLYKRCCEFNLVLLESKSSIYLLNCLVCGVDFSISKNNLNDRIRNRNTICLKCNPISNKSNYEKILFEYISGLYLGEVVVNNRKLIGKELDIYLPNLKIAFEFNGIYWHSNIFKLDCYHYDKTNSCLSVGISLIHIWENDFVNKREIIFNKINNILNRSNVDISNCKISNISIDCVKDFIDNNSLYNYVKSDINIGLFNGNELISIIIFFDGELLEYCNKYNTRSLSILLDYYILNFNIKYITTYIDRSWLFIDEYLEYGFMEDMVLYPELLENCEYDVYNSGYLKLIYNKW